MSYVLSDFCISLSFTPNQSGADNPYKPTSSGRDNRYDLVKKKNYTIRFVNGGKNIAGDSKVDYRSASVITIIRAWIIELLVKRLRTFSRFTASTLISHKSNMYDNKTR